MSKDKRRFHDRQMKLLCIISHGWGGGRIINHIDGLPESKELYALEHKGLITIRRIHFGSVFGPHIRKTYAKSTLGKTR